VISTGNIPMIFLTSTLITAGTYAISNAIYPAWFSELFNVKVRYSGMAIGLQIGILCAGFTPLLGTALRPMARETSKTPLRALGTPSIRG